MVVTHNGQRFNTCTTHGANEPAGYRSSPPLRSCLPGPNLESNPGVSAQRERVSMDVKLAYVFVCCISHQQLFISYNRK